MEISYDYENADRISIDTLALEEMVQEERQREISNLNKLSNKVCYLHTSLLYYRNVNSKMGIACYEAWKTLIKRIGGTSNGWRDLGYNLGITQDDLNYIMNSVKDDPGDVVLKVYMQNETATLDKILNAFIKMNRYDVLKAIEEPFCDLARCFNKDDSGYHSGSKNSGTREIISFTKNLQNDLPPALNKKYVIKEKEPNRPQQPLIRPPMKPVEKTMKNDSPILFLTFAEDGLQTAYNIQYYVSNWTDITGVTVLTLNDRREEVYQNPEKFIRDYFEKADYIVPILTTGYLNEIVSHNTTASNTDGNLDFKYVKFIYNLMVNHYIHVSGCLNKKFRSVLPQSVNMDVCRSLDMYPVLLPWTNEDTFDEYFKVFLKKEYSC